MKELVDGTRVSARSYYYLLDWNDRNNWGTVYSMFQKNGLHELNKTEYTALFEAATQSELKTLKS